MQSNNPVFARSEGFKQRGTTTTEPAQWNIDLDGSAPTQTPGGVSTSERRMTVDTVVEKTGITIGVVAIVAAVTWFLIGDTLSPDTAEASSAMALAGGLAVVGALVGFVLAMVNSFKKIISPGLVLIYAAMEGVFVGAISKLISSFVGDASIVFQAVLGTVIAFAGTLFVYKFFNIQVGDKFRKVVMASVLAFASVIIVNLILSLTGVFESGGLRGFNTLGLVVSLVAVVIAVLCLIMDFDFVERGIAAGLPERESWRAAFGLTVTLIWLYLEILRVLAILRGD